MSDDRKWLVLAAALVIGFAATGFSTADHQGGGGGHNHAHHSDGNGGTWHMQDHQVRHCDKGTEAKPANCSPWM